MHSLAHYALFGSLVAGAIGALVLAAVTVKHGISRREGLDADQTPEDTARREHSVRVADSVRIVIGCEASDALVRPIETVRAALSQRSANNGCRSAGPNAAIEAPACGI